jgi:hypothetical protein
LDVKTVGSVSTAYQKARDDVAVTCGSLGFSPIELQSSFSRIGRLMAVPKLNMALGRLGPSDLLLTQHPLNSRAFYATLSGGARGRGYTNILLVHDIDYLRYGYEIDAGITLAEKTALQGADGLITLTTNMSEYLTGIGVAKPMTPMYLWDYLTPCTPRAAGSFSGTAVFAGNLNKAAFLRHLPAGLKLRVYGPGREEDLKGAVDYAGVFPADDLPGILDGDFGLVWDGDSPDSGAGDFGTYLRYNAQHKLSLYLAAGLPVAVWDQAGTASFVTDNHVGWAIASLGEFRERLKSTTAAEYAELRTNATKVGEQIRSGHFLRSAIERITALTNG